MTMIRAVILALCMLASATPVLAQSWPPRPVSPADDAARARADRERWRAGLDARQAEARERQLLTDLTLYDLQAARSSALLPTPEPLPDSAPLSGLAQGAETDRLTAQDALRRLDAMDAWFDRLRRTP